ncbi:MAG: tetratricopeptide repeat protein [Thermoguttaceae bacterium]|nr:tetratricopeptide repeat protein [Thermoguttaceae bacterium]
MEQILFAVAAVLFVAGLAYFFALPYYYGRLAFKYSGQKNFPFAERYYWKALRISPRDASLWRGLALTLRNLGAADRALDALRRAGELAPDRADIMADRVDFLRAAGRFDEALNELNWTLENNDYPPNVLLTRAAVFLDLQRYAEAEKDADRAIETAENEFLCARAFNLRGLAKLADGRDGEAESDFETAYLIDPGLLDAQMHCVASWIRRGAPASALNYFDSLLKINPNNVEALHLRGMAKAALGDALGAESDWKTADEMKLQ